MRSGLRGAIPPGAGISMARTIFARGVLLILGLLIAAVAVLAVVMLLEQRGLL